MDVLEEGTSEGAGLSRLALRFGIGTPRFAMQNVGDLHHANHASPGHQANRLIILHDHKLTKAPAGENTETVL